VILLDKREIAYTKRNALSMKEVQIKSETILKNLEPYLKGIVGIYMAYGHEVDITKLLKQADITCCVPVCDGDYQMSFYLVDENTVFKKSHYGILEPVNAKIIDKNEIDMIIVPMVAFDAQRHRMGHGKGYYDRYLKDYQGMKIGVAFECQKFPQLDVYPHDIPMDLIISEDAKY